MKGFQKTESPPVPALSPQVKVELTRWNREQRVSENGATLPIDREARAVQEVSAARGSAAAFVGR
jgi:hypothetical protein